MPRNLNGVYTLPEPPYVQGTIIESSVMNSNLSDIASALTGSLATTGVSFMTAPLEGFTTGSNQNPSFRFGNALGTGFYSTTGNIGIASTSVVIGNIATSATTTYSYKHFFADTVIFLSAVNITGGISASVTITGDLIVTKGLNVGFSATATEDIIKLGDELNYLDATDLNLPLWLFDTNDFMFYDRTNNKYTYEINNTIVKSIDANTALYSGLIRLQEIAAPGSASAGQANIYLKDNSGTTRAAYKDEQGVETFMGGPGQWELVSQSDIATSVGSVTFNLTKVYSRIVLNIMGLSCNSGTGFLFANISDDGGATLVSCRSCIANLTTDIFATAGLSIMRVSAQPVINLRAEINRANKVGPKQYFSLSGDTNGEETYFGAGQSASCSVVNAIVIANNVTNMVTGTIQVWGLMAI